MTYFSESLRAPIAVTGLAAASTQDSEATAFAEERLVAMVRDARYVFAGPGSPSYALRKWLGSAVPGLLAEKLTQGGCVVFASAAALTLGVATVPVYEIYKCGEDPHWLDGLDITSAAGLRAAIIPHYDNSEGGTHDTRFCYLGERRLSVMERDLPEGAFVLGIDEHTACLFDISDGTASVEGRGVVTVRAGGRSATFPSGEKFPISRIIETADELARGNRVAGIGNRMEVGVPPAPSGRPPVTSPLVDIVREREAEFAAALEARNMPLAANTVLELESDVTQWSTDIPAGDELDRAHASLRSLIFELGRLSETGTRDPRGIVGPFIEVLLELRDGARRDGRFEEADLVRERLAECGIEVRDTPHGSEWLFTGGAAAGADGQG